MIHATLPHLLSFSFALAFSLFSSSFSFLSRPLFFPCAFLIPSVYFYILLFPLPFSFYHSVCLSPSPFKIHAPAMGPLPRSHGVMRAVMRARLAKCQQSLMHIRRELMQNPLEGNTEPLIANLATLPPPHTRHKSFIICFKSSLSYLSTELQ